MALTGRAAVAALIGALVVLAFCLAVPFSEDDGGHFDVLPQLVRGMTAQE